MCNPKQILGFLEEWNGIYIFMLTYDNYLEYNLEYNKHEYIFKICVNIYIFVNMYSF